LRVAIADDSALFRAGVRRILEAAEIEVSAEAADGDELLRLVAEDPPDVAIVDIRMPPTRTYEGLEVAANIRRRHPDVGVLVLSSYVEAEFAYELLSEGQRGSGYLLKDRVSDEQELVEALERLAAGGSVVDPNVVSMLVRMPRIQSPVARLTEREQEILSLMAEGRSNTAIAQRLFLSERTVESNVSRIFAKLGLLPAEDDHRRVLAVLTYLRDGRTSERAE
jgi:DNA-binding NarL/FixJ family response regulator